ncbi:unnamed protein product [Closterium sp. NIES-54]
MLCPPCNMMGDACTSPHGECMVFGAAHVVHGACTSSFVPCCFHHAIWSLRRTAPLEPTNRAYCPRSCCRRALPCSLRAAALPCPALSRYPAAYFPDRRMLPCSPRATLLAVRCPALRSAHLLPCPPTCAPPFPAARTPSCPAARRRPAPQPARRPALQPTRRPALQPARHPALLPVRRPALQPVRRPALQPAKRVLRYLCSTSSMGLMLGGQGSVVLIGHSDASWADDQATQRSS